MVGFDQKIPVHLLLSIDEFVHSGWDPFEAASSQIEEVWFLKSVLSHRAVHLVIWLLTPRFSYKAWTRWAGILSSLMTSRRRHCLPKYVNVLFFYMCPFSSFPHCSQPSSFKRKKVLRRKSTGFYAGLYLWNLEECLWLPCMWATVFKRGYRRVTGGLLAVPSDSPWHSG